MQQVQQMAQSSAPQAMPKPPVRNTTSPYGFFVKMCYEEYQKRFDDAKQQLPEITRRCSVKWKTMTEDEKRRFFDLARQDAER